MNKLLRKIKSGEIYAFGKLIEWKIGPARYKPKKFYPESFTYPYRLHLGPGPRWVKPSSQWINVDVDPKWGDLVIDFQRFAGLPLENESVECIYGSHVFEHMSIWVTDAVFAECFRVLKPGGCLRIVIPDAERSIREYLAGNADYPIFQRRTKRAKNKYGVEYTLFDCLREDFVSRSSQQNLLGTGALAHQNAWDFDSISRDLKAAGFSEVNKVGLSKSNSSHFDFEGSYVCEALQEDRSLYVEAYK